MSLKFTKITTQKSSALNNMNPILKRVIEKEANIGGAIKSVGNFLGKAPALRYGATALKHAPTAVALPWLGESAIRTGGNLLDGKFEMSGAPTTSSVLGSGLNYLGTVTGINPAIQNLGNHLAAGAASNAGVQDIVKKLNDSVTTLNQTVTHPNTSKALSAVTQGVDALKGNEAARANLADTVQQGASGLTQGAFEGLFKSFGSMVTDPKTLAWLLIGGTAPMVIYDLLTRKKREERLALDKKILQALNQKQAAEKTASFNWARILSHKPTIPSGVLESLAASGATPNQVIKAVQPYNGGWSVLNNPITRNPIKSLLGGSATIGTGVGVADALTQNPQEITFGSTFSKLLKGLASGPVNLVHDLEVNALQRGLANDGYKKLLSDPAVANVKTLYDNLNATSANAEQVVNNAKSYQGPLSPEVGQTPLLAHLKKNLPWYGLSSLALAAPFALHYGYDKMVNKRINRKADQIAGLHENLLDQ